MSNEWEDCPGYKILLEKIDPLIETVKNMDSFLRNGDDDGLKKQIIMAIENHLNQKIVDRLTWLMRVIGVAAIGGMITIFAAIIIKIVGG